MTRFFRLIVWLVLPILLAGALGCNTVRGVGKDVERGGEEIQELAK